MNSIVSFASNIVSQVTVMETAVEPRIIGFDAQMLAQVLLHIISVLLLFYLLGKLLFKPVRELLQKRKEKIASEYEHIKTEKEQAETAKNNYEEKLSNIKQEADEILATARKKALERENEIINEARAEADRIITRANLETAREKEKAKDEVKKEIIEVATIMASKFVASSIDPQTRDNLLEETLNAMGDDTWLN